MSNVLDELQVLIEDLNLSDVIVSGNLAYQRLSTLVSKLSDKQRTLTAEWHRSDLYKEKLKKENAALERARNTKKERQDKIVAWCDKNIKVGDIVKVTGTVSNKFRKVVGKGETPAYRSTYGTKYIRNCSYDVTTGREYPQTTTTYLAHITHRYNPETRLWDKITDLVKAEHEANSNSGGKPPSSSML